MRRPTKRQAPRIDEAAYQAALEELAALKDDDGDTSWADDLPGPPKLPG